MAPASLLSGLPELSQVPPTALFSLAFLGIVSTAIATILYLQLVVVAGPSFISLINYLIPPWAVLIGILFLGEQLDWTALIGLALILSGIALAETKGRQAS